MLNMTQAKFFRGPDILIKSIYLNFYTKISSFSLFGHPAWLKYPFISLAYPYLKKALKMFNITKAKLLRRPKIFVMSIYLKFCTKISSLSFLDTLYGYNNLLLARSSNMKNFGAVASAPLYLEGGGGGSKIPVLKIGRGYLPKQFWFTIFIYLTPLAQPEL